MEHSSVTCVTGGLKNGKVRLCIEKLRIETFMANITMHSPGQKEQKNPKKSLLEV